uniref:Putative S-adenosyl-L-methionine-dependent methyltransferase n=1 Tax=Tanacetum cinerariifolium TaxID=118510 RepID=A0A6L2NF61_TANCI|nr:putative S-adenosyl-L-methionine-dependent methyltransferase [Tanacetum cinerariifolium]
MSTTTIPTTNNPPVPDHLLRQLQTIRATINHLTRLHPTSRATTNVPSELLLYTQLNPIASACRHHPELLHQYMNYTPFAQCPPSSTAAGEPLILRGCHPLPRRRCFSFTPAKTPTNLPSNPFSPFSQNSILWANYNNCKSKSLDCYNPEMGFDLSKEKSRFLSFKSDLDLPISQFLDIAKKGKTAVRLGLDIGGGTVRCGHAVNSKGVDLDKVYGPLIGKLGYKKVKWAVGKKEDASGVKNGEVYLTALLQKPVSR